MLDVVEYKKRFCAKTHTHTLDACEIFRANFSAAGSGRKLTVLH